MLDVTARAVVQHIASHPAERGGVLLGTGGIAAMLVPDQTGTGTPTAWWMGPPFTDQVADVEGMTGFTTVGTVHSHPDSYVDPSPPDLQNHAEILALNGHLQSQMIAVLTHRHDRRPHDLDLGDDIRLAVWSGQRSRGGEAVFRAAEPRVVPLGRLVDGVAGRFDGAVAAAPVPVTIDGDTHVALEVVLADGRTVLVAVADGWPWRVPFIAIANNEGVLQAPGPVAGWDPGHPMESLIGAVAAATRSAPPAMLARVAGLTGAISSKKVIIAGLGSGGSRIATTLVRSGVQRQVLVDPDLVSEENLSRSEYAACDVGLPKTEALAARLSSINPAVELELHRAGISTLDLKELLADADLAIGATDDPIGQAALAYSAYAAGVPFIAAGLYERAEAGEIVLVVPARRSPCHYCQTGRSSGEAMPDHDYGTGRLKGEVALAPLIDRVTTVVTEHAIGLLAGGEVPAGRKTAALLDQGRTLCILFNDPSHPLSHGAFDRPYQSGGPATMWLPTASNPECGLCGAGTHYGPPFITDHGDHRNTIELASTPLPSARARRRSKLQELETSGGGSLHTGRTPERDMESEPVADSERS
jgi:molybdopterin/thiamine biosynthesis adenylyltransferase/proteasome lid subunit RPN8/RPN11